MKNEGVYERKVTSDLRFCLQNAGLQVQSSKIFLMHQLSQKSHFYHPELTGTDLNNSTHAVICHLPHQDRKFHKAIARVFSKDKNFCSWGLLTDNDQQHPH